MTLQRERPTVCRGGCTTSLIRFLLCLLLTTSSFAQVSQPYRYEKKQKSSEDYPTIVPLKDEGLALVQSKEKYNGSKRFWEVLILDTTLQEKKTVQLAIENRHNLVGYEYVPGYFYLLYRSGDTNKNALLLFEFTTSGELAGQYEIKPELDFKLSYFIKTGTKIIFGGYVSKEPVILIYEPATNLIKVVPGFFQKDSELVDLRANQNNTFNTILIDRSKKAEKKLLFKTFDENGKLLLEDIIAMDDKKSLQTSLATTLEQEDLLIMGTWGDRQAKESSGFFMLNVDPFTDQKIQYFYLGQLTHFLDYIKPSRAEHIRQKTDRAIIAGHNPDFCNYVMPFKIEETKEGFLLLAEVYTPVNTMNQFNGPFGSPMFGGPFYANPYSYFNPYWPSYYAPGRMYNPFAYNSFNNNTRSYSEIHTTETVLMAVDAKGNLVWDVSMQIEEISRMTLEQISDFYYSPGRIVFLYKKKDGQMKIKFIDLADDESKVINQKIKLANELDEFRSENDKGGLRKWYRNSFYVWGYQTIRNINTEDRVRDVFYINKVEVR